jgi:peptidoglycan/LPS O-acetylase OafA/YrhL
MYLLLPFLFWWMKRTSNRYLAIMLWGSFTVAAVLGTMPSAPRALHGFVFAPMFLGGMVAFQKRDGARFLSANLWPAFVIGLIALRIALLRGESIETQWNAFVNASMCLVLGLAIPHFRDLRGHLITKVSQKIAQYSYGVYLLHMPLLILWFQHVRAPVQVQALGWMVTTVALSVLAYHAIEAPMIRVGKSIVARQEKALMAAVTV